MANGIKGAMVTRNNTTTKPLTNQLMIRGKFCHINKTEMI
jgi:hypothetical protein